VLTVSDSTFTGDSSQIGGAVYSYDTATLTGGRFTGNAAGQGGAIDNDGGVAGARDVFSKNTAREVGGVAYSTGELGLGRSSGTRPASTAAPST
jgi:hypothetical protein